MHHDDLNGGNDPAIILRKIVSATQVGIAMDLIPTDWYVSLIHNPKDGNATASIVPPGDQFARLRRAAVAHGLDTGHGETRLAAMRDAARQAIGCF